MRKQRNLAIVLLACLGTSPTWAQARETETEDAKSSGGWRRADEPRPRERDRDDEQDRDADRDRAPDSRIMPPARIELAAGTWIVIRVNEPLSSDHSMPGDVYSATLVQPLIGDGFVVARRGQTVGGRVAEAVRAGKARGTSRLGLELTEITLADGRQLPVRTQLIDMTGGTSKGRDATAIGTGAGAGAAIGAAASGGFGAGMGAIAGAAASTIGVLMTRGRATEVLPETALTFRLLEPVTVNTERSSHAFQAVRQGDYEQRQLQRRVSQRAPTYWGGGYWGSYYSPYSPFFYGWGPSFYYYSGPRFYGRGGGWGGGIRGGGRRR